MSNSTTLAGHKLRLWRKANNVSAESLGETLGRMLGEEKPVPVASIYNWEQRGKDARPVVRKALAELGACDAGDWLEPAPQEAA